MILAVLLPASPGFPAEEGTRPLPSLELLEFLGDWETDAGEWLAPEEVEKRDLPEQEQGNDKIRN
ncbi:MAG: hypothetical protein KKG47_16865 [Proteobacteria bacterium]|nr:hypothetical protein [Pseudomonadota bacterium]MBU1736517.1 hypothetical protein [Pseudomonadota bacterium]